MQGSRFQLANTDAVEWLRSLPSESIDLVVTDPPYESLEKHRAIGTTTRLKHSKASSNDWFAIFPNTRFAELFAEIHRVLKRDRHFYLYCDPETMFIAKPLAEAAGFRFWKPLIWDKCLGPDTLVWTERGTVRMADVVPGDKVALPNGGTTTVVATRTTRAPAVRLKMSDHTSIVASTEHRFMRASGEIAETRDLDVEDRLASRYVALPPIVDIQVDGASVPLDYAMGVLMGMAAGGEKPNELVVETKDCNGSTIDVTSKFHALLEHFVGGEDADTTFLKPLVYAAPAEFRSGLLAGLLQQGTYGSPDLDMFVHREQRRELPSIVAIEQLGEQELVDISVAHEDELFLLANGVVTHNCRIGMGYHYRARYECILFFEKGKRKLNDLGTADIIEHNRVVNGYPAEKPPEVSEVLVTQSTQPGEVVIDPFMGSGSVGVAAIKNGRHFRGNDLCDEAITIARTRLRELGADEAPIGTGDPTPAVGQLGLRV